MPLKIKLTDIGAEPEVVCDHCGKQIEAAERGGYEWLDPENGKPGDLVEVVFLHKDCSYAHELASGSLWDSMELSVLLPYLVHTLDVDMKKATTLADLLQSTGRITGGPS